MDRSKNTIRRTVACVLLVFAGALAARAQPTHSGNALPLRRVQVVTGEYVGGVHGAPAFATVSFERLADSVLMAGQIRSGQFLYTFRVDLLGSSGFGEMVSHVEGTRLQIKIDLTPMGFALTAHPFGPGMPTTYAFTRQ